jgi:hypothetical protein
VKAQTPKGRDHTFHPSVPITPQVLLLLLFCTKYFFFLKKSDYVIRWKKGEKPFEEVIL